MKAAVLVSVPVKDDLHSKIKAGLHPQQDFFALAEALDADLLTPLNGPQRKRSPKLVRLFHTAWSAFRQRSKYDLIISDTERVGIILATLLKIAGSNTRHIMICHGKVARQPDLGFVRTLKLQTHIHRFVCYGPAVAGRLQDALGLTEEQVVTLQHPADHRFWKPSPSSTPQRLIVSAGMLRRDYPTLVEAVRHLDVSLTIAASSPWVDHGSTGIRKEGLLSNVQITRCNYTELRDLYARSSFVAVPLVGSHAQSGSLVIYEAMAMGKAVVATRTEGQDALHLVEEGVTGYYLAPGDVDGWRSTIVHLLDHPEEAQQMGLRARGRVEAGLNMDTYVSQMSSVAHALLPGDRSAVRV